MYDVGDWKADALREMVATQVADAMDRLMGRDDTVRRIMGLRYLGEPVTRAEVSRSMGTVYGKYGYRDNMIGFRERRGVQQLREWLRRGEERGIRAWSPTALGLAWHAESSTGAMTGAGIAVGPRTLYRRDPLTALAVEVLDGIFPWEMTDGGLRVIRDGVASGHKAWPDAIASGPGQR